MRKPFAVLALCFIVLLHGCEKKSTQPPPSVIEVDTKAQVIESAEDGGQVSWQTAPGNTDSFTITFSKKTPCSDGSQTLHGGPNSPAQCTAAGVGHYDYTITTNGSGGTSTSTQQTLSVTPCKACKQ